jgi:hypothetical protein
MGAAGIGFRARQWTTVVLGLDSIRARSHSQESLALS